MRLIDADKVKIESRKHCIDCKINGTKHCKTCVVNLICDRLDLQPTVEERPHGKWIEDIEYNNIFKCSECRKVIEMKRKTYIFCPYCSADMRS